MVGPDGFDAGLADVPEGRVACLFDEDDDLEDEIDVERAPPRDCASISGWNAVNANPISIAAKVVADNLIVFEFAESIGSEVSRYGTSAIIYGKKTRLSANIP